MLGWFVAAAIALHDLPEGMAIGAGSALAPRVGLLIAIAIALHNIPEGMSIAAPLAMGGVSRRRIWTTTLLIGLITPGGTVLAYVLGALSPVTSTVMLALAAGAMTYVAGWNTLPESFQLSPRAACLGMLAGALIMLGTHAALSAR
jgi:ZIP family zinc transporter